MQLSENEIKLNERFKKFLDDNHITQAEFGRLVSVKRATVGSWVNLRSKVPMRVLYYIIENYPHVNAGWLIEGKVNYTIVDNPTVIEDKSELIQSLRKTIKSQELLISSQAELIEMKNKELESLRKLCSCKE